MGGGERRKDYYFPGLSSGRREVSIVDTIELEITKCKKDTIKYLNQLSRKGECNSNFPSFIEALKIKYDLNNVPRVKYVGKLIAGFLEGEIAEGEFLDKYIPAVSGLGVGLSLLSDGTVFEPISHVERVFKNCQN